MTIAHELPLSGYSIVKVYTTLAELRLQPVKGLETNRPGFNFGWDWQLQERDLFEVRITVGIEPVKERPYSAKVDVIGRFRKGTDTPSVSLGDFVALQAVAILLPYARQFLTNLTVNSLTGPYYLPSLNVARLVQGFDASKATGARQIDARKTETPAGGDTSAMRKRLKQAPKTGRRKKHRTGRASG